MKYFKILLFTTTLFMNISFGAGQELEDEQASSYVAFGDNLYRNGGFIGAIAFYQSALDIAVNK